MNPLEGRRPLDPLHAHWAFEAIMWDPNITLADAREGFLNYIEHEKRHNRVPQLWTCVPQEVAACAIMGIHPQTGEPLENPDDFVQNYDVTEYHPFINDDSAHFRQEALRVYEELKKDPGIQRALAAETPASGRSL